LVSTRGKSDLPHQHSYISPSLAKSREDSLSPADLRLLQRSLHADGQHGFPGVTLDAQLRQAGCRDAQPHVNPVALGIYLAPHAQVQA